MEVLGSICSIPTAQYEISGGLGADRSYHAFVKESYSHWKRLFSRDQ
jgi:hypothetical protein